MKEFCIGFGCAAMIFGGLLIQQMAKPIPQQIKMNQNFTNQEYACFGKCSEVIAASRMVVINGGELIVNPGPAVCVVKFADNDFTVFSDRNTNFKTEEEALAFAKAAGDGGYDDAREYFLKEKQEVI